MGCSSVVPQRLLTHDVLARARLAGNGLGGDHPTASAAGRSQRNKRRLRVPFGSTSTSRAFFSQVTIHRAAGALNAVVRFLVRFVDSTTYSFTGKKRPACCCAA